MVRLKVEDRTKYFDLAREISIPYGAIKSQGGASPLFNKKIISIPYGAIKSRVVQ